MIRSRLAERRRFLKLVGATALTYPFLRSVPSFANTSDTNPIFLVLLFSSCGVVRYKWGAQGMAPANDSPPSSTAKAVVTPGPLAFRDTLSPFAAAKPLVNGIPTGAAVDLSKYVTVLDGLNNAAAAGGSHEQGMGSLWTGTLMTGTATIGPSIDQAIAPLLSSQLGITRAYPSVNLYAPSSTDAMQASIDTRMLYEATGNYMTPLNIPSQALSSIFQTAASQPAMTSGPPDPTAAIKGAVASNLNSELTALQARLCKEDAYQIQNLQEMWNQADQQQMVAQQMIASAAQSCNPPTIAGLGVQPTSGDPFPYNVGAMSTILAMTLACDLTRVASLQLSTALSLATHTWIDSTQNQPHHVYSHAGPTSLYSLGTNLYGTTSTASNTTFASMYTDALPDNLASPNLANIDKWYATQVASLAATLHSIPFGSGTLLDQTVICWGSELDMGAAHNHDNTPFLLIGGGGGKLKTGQLVGFPMNLGNNASNRASGPVANASPGNRYHNDLLLTLASVMGVTLPGGTFGASSLCTGPITEVLTGM